MDTQEDKSDGAENFLLPVYCSAFPPLCVMPTTEKKWKLNCTARKSCQTARAQMQERELKYVSPALYIMEREKQLRRAGGKRKTLWSS